MALNPESELSTLFRIILNHDSAFYGVLPMECQDIEQSWKQLFVFHYMGVTRSYAEWIG